MEGRLIITLKDGALSVVGPIENPLVCYAMLEAARDVVHAKAQEAQRLIKPANIMPEFGKRD